MSGYWTPRFCFLMVTLIGMHESLVSALANDEPKEPIILVSPMIFRTHATTVLLPEYPSYSQKAGHVGRVTAEVDIAGNGKTTAIRILEAPDSAMGDSVRSALLKWAFRPFRRMDNQSALAARSRLIFYFSIKDGKATVVDGAAVAIKNIAAK